MSNKKDGLTLVELLIAIFLFFILTASVIYVLRTVLWSWTSSEKRSGVNIDIDFSLEEMSRELRKAKNIQSSNNEIRYSLDGANFYIYYFYSALDTYPLAFNQTLYQLRKAQLTGGIGGTFTFGQGQLIVIDVLPPPISNLSFSSSLITIDLSIKRGDETVREKTKIKPRNL